MQWGLWLCMHMGLHPSITVKLKYGGVGRLDDYAVGVMVMHAYGVSGGLMVMQWGLWLCMHMGCREAMAMQ